MLVALYQSKASPMRHRNAKWSPVCKLNNFCQIILR